MRARVTPSAVPDPCIRRLRFSRYGSDPEILRERERVCPDPSCDKALRPLCGVDVSDAYASQGRVAVAVSDAYASPGRVAVAVSDAYASPGIVAVAVSDAYASPGIVAVAVSDAYASPGIVAVAQPG
jgi:hypothetical protein